ncbi:protein piccolo-like [Sabethes cyaneus]|uniref:protein piccolo-like n=1 Tax=Sabethes cyaneus TaxID=53552 RepID=UPI00237E69F0|nr:protein piccolo-like [Sabethes cyaneus]
MERILLFVLLAVVAVPGQQYTGVKSVSSSDASDADVQTPTKTGHEASKTVEPAAISGRSIGKSPNRVPLADSKIIKLSIKTIEPQVISGSRGARNLGFAADASLNAIPGGLNNELTNADFKPPVTLASTVAKDSYGNPVTPYTDLGSTGLESVGFLTDVNKENLHSSKTNQVSNLNFKVPSYASGILEPVLLPPNNYNNGQNQYTQPSIGGGTTPQLIPNVKYPTVEEGKILFAQKPLNGLLPPLFPGEQGPTYNVEVGTERSPPYAKDPFSGAPLDTELRLPNDKPPVDFNQRPFTPPSGPVQTPQQTPQIIQAPPRPSVPPQPTQAPTQKYTGGFGGAPGFLGNQQNLGTAYKSTTPIPSTPPKPVSFQPAPPQLPQTPTPFQPQPQPQLTTKAPGSTFTGSFGFTNNPQPQRPVTQNFPQQPQPTKAPGSTYTGGFGFTNNSPQPQRPTNQNFPQQQPQPTKPPGGTYTGGFGFVSNNNQQPPQQPQQPQQPRPTTQRPGQYVGNKFSGSFGGAPGLLGNQKQPGTHVKPDGGILPPSSPGVVAAGFPTGPTPATTGSSKPTHSSSTVGGGAFAGSFGGPPGILRPFDNVNG